MEAPWRTHIEYTSVAPRTCLTAVAPRRRHEGFVIHLRMHYETPVEPLCREAFVMNSRCFHRTSTGKARRRYVMEASKILHEYVIRTAKASRRRIQGFAWSCCEGFAECSLRLLFASICQIMTGTLHKVTRYTQV